VFLDFRSTWQIEFHFFGFALRVLLMICLCVRVLFGCVGHNNITANWFRDFSSSVWSALQNPKNKERKEQTANEKAKRKAMFLSSVCGVSASFPQVMSRVLNVLVFLFGLYLGTVC
jgi:hypothetical protein